MPSPDETRQPCDPQSIALTGFMAAGKSTVGRALAWLLKWRFFDLDCEIECRSGNSVREIFALEGESRFRAIESEALRAVLNGSTTSSVIALGGGTFVQQENADLLRERGVRVVFLELPLEQLLHRCRELAGRSEQNPRPLAEDERTFCALYAERLPWYRKADLIVNGNKKAPEQIASEIAQALRLHVPAGPGTPL